MSKSNSDTSPSRIGLALSSGGARGFAHVGVINALQQAGLQIAGVTGSSMGGIIAAGYAVRGDVAELERHVLAWRANDYRRRWLPVMDPARLIAFLDDVLGEADFADCVVPLTIVATDLERRVATAIREGSVALATFASTAIPFLHRPVEWGGQLLADGSLTCALPMVQASEQPVDLVIGSMVSQPAGRIGAYASGLARNLGGALRGWGQHYVSFFREWAPQPPWTPDESGDDESTSHGIRPPTLILSPQLDQIGPLDFSRAREAIAAGEEAVGARLDEIRALLQRWRE